MSSPKKTKKKSNDKHSNSDEVTAESLRREIAAEQKAKDAIEWGNVELERSVRAMEVQVLQLEAGNVDLDDSEARQKFENQKQLNLQLLEQKRWLEHELEQIKQKIQNEKLDLPDPFSLDWDNLSETELKRLVVQLERTRNDLRSDLREMEWRLDKEGKEFHHHDEFCRMYQAEIKNLNRIIDSLMRNGVLPSSFQFNTSQSSSQGSSYPSTGGAPTPGGGGFLSIPLSPTRKLTAGSSSTVTLRRISPQRRSLSPPGKNVAGMDANAETALGRKKVRNLPKMETTQTTSPKKKSKDKQVGDKRGNLRSLKEVQE